MHTPLTTIPYIGKKIASYFERVGIMGVEDLRGRDPEDIYQAICDDHGYRIDRCLLYTCRSAVYYAEHAKHDPEKLKWWNWKD
ncbi:MAG: pathogenicity locus [Candidatus Peribacteria bacterium]|nr:MAG: pathogenicity locus [Candidatus Peribacteria bacterium]